MVPQYVTVGQQRMTNVTKLPLIHCKILRVGPNVDTCGMLAELAMYVVVTYRQPSSKW
jgi:hypothetical protein